MRWILVLALILVAVPSFAAVDYELATSAADTMTFDFGASDYEIYSDDADALFKIRHAKSGAWTDFFPKSGSPKSHLRLFAGVPWARSWTYGAEPDSVQVIVIPSAATDIQVEAR